VDVIELGVQSFDPEVLRLSNRGHTKNVVYSSSEKILAYGFELGIQLMIGLPGDSYEKCMASVEETIKIGPSLARLYPTVILKDTKLFEQYREGSYKPFTKEKMLRTTTDMYRKLQENNITILRVGLKSTDLISENGELISSTYHPAFRQLVQGEIAKEDLERQLLASLEGRYNKEKILKEKMGDGASKPVVTFLCERTSFSNMIGNCRRNKNYFEKKYPQFSFRFKIDESLPAERYQLNIL